MQTGNKIDTCNLVGESIICGCPESSSKESDIGGLMFLLLQQDTVSKLATWNFVQLFRRIQSSRPDAYANSSCFTASDSGYQKWHQLFGSLSVLWIRLKAWFYHHWQLQHTKLFHDTHRQRHKTVRLLQKISQTVWTPHQLSWCDAIESGFDSCYLVEMDAVHYHLCRCSYTHS